MSAVEAWESLLSAHFHIEREVPGRSADGKRYRIDMLLHPLFDWPSGGRHPIGFEVKRPAPSVATFTKSLAQAVDYTRAQWYSQHRDSPLRVYVAIYDNYTPLFCPDVARLAERIAGRLNVGFMRLDAIREDVTLETSGERRWSLRNGRSGAAFNAIPKDGSR